MTLARNIITGLLVCLMLALFAGCASRTAKTGAVQAPEPYAYDAGGRAYYRDDTGRPYTINEHGDRQYGTPAQAGDKGVTGYRADTGGIAFYVEPGGRRYLRGDRGRKLYVEDRVDTIYMDETGRRYYVDPSGTSHWLETRGGSNYMEGTTAMRRGGAARDWFADETGRRFYFTERGGSYIVDESGAGYYVIGSERGGPVQIIRMRAYTSDPGEAAMLRCHQDWNQCFLRCNQRQPVSEQCVRNCDRDLDACSGRR